MCLSLYICIAHCRFQVQDNEYDEDKLEKDGLAMDNAASGMYST